MKLRRYHWLEEKINAGGYKIGCEVGVAVGNTTKHLLKHCPDLTLYAVDDFKPAEDRPPEAMPLLNRKVYIYPYRPLFDEAVAPYRNRLTVLEGTSWEMADHIADESLDFVFIDASHDFSSVISDIVAWLPKVKKTGLLCGHDVHLPGVYGALNYLELNYIKVGIDNVWYL